MQHTFSVSYNKEKCLSFRSLTKEQLDMLILAQLLAHTDTNATTSSSNKNISLKAKVVHFPLSLWPSDLSEDVSVFPWSEQEMPLQHCIILPQAWYCSESVRQHKKSSSKHPYSPIG